MATASSHARRLAARNEVTTATPAVGPSQTTSGRGPAAQFDLSSGAATAVVFLSIVLCFILLCTYCRCARQRARAGDDDQEVVLERVVAMIEAIREEQAAARRAQGSAAAGGR